MIITKTPFRVSLFGGSTDYESFYTKNGSLLIGFTMDKYCYISLRRSPEIFDYRSKISYSQVETVDNNSEIKHDGVRGTLEYLGLEDEPLEITHFADLPARTGTGSSSSFVVGLINACSEYKGYGYSCSQLAEKAVEIERFYLDEPGGIQDQIWAANGGFNSIEIPRNGRFSVRPLPLSSDFIDQFFRRSVLLYTGSQRNSFELANSNNGSEATKGHIMRLARDAYTAFANEDLGEIGKLLKYGWIEKKKISDSITNSHVDRLMLNLEMMGMVGGKLLGSGQSGFIFGLCKDEKAKENIKRKFSKQYIECGLSTQGSRVIQS